MKAQLAIIALIVFGAGLVVLGFVRLPYTVVDEEEALIQTSTTSLATLTEVVTTTQTHIDSTSITTAVHSVVTETVTYTSTTTSKKSLEAFTDLTFGTSNPLLFGPYTLDPNTALELYWNGSGFLDVYLLLSDELPNDGRPLTWRAFESSSQGNITYRPSTSEAIHILIYPREPSVFVSSLVASQLSFITSAATTTRLTSIATTSLYTTTYPVYETVTATTTRVEPTKILYTTQITTVFTETRYSELTFAAFMGSFLIFVGIVLMALLLRVLPKIPQETKK